MTWLPSGKFPQRAILCITLCMSSTASSLTGPSVVAFGFFFCMQMPARADALNAMKAREYLQKGNVHLTRLEFQQALDAYTECLLCDPNNRTAKENIVLTHNNWGIWWFQKRKYKEARGEWEQALKLNPMDRNARANMQVLRVTLKQQGLTEDGEKPAPPPAQKTGSDFPPSQIIILTPGLKSSAGAANSGNSAPAGEASTQTTETSSGASLLGGSSSPSSESSSGGAVIIKKTEPATTSGGDASGAISTYSSGSPETPSGKFTTAPMTPVPAQSSSSNQSSGTSNATADGSQGGNIEDSLGQIEQKIYGRKQDSLPIMKRLEKLENDTHGKTKSGTIKERIDTLRKSYGF